MFPGQNSHFVSVNTSQFIWNLFSILVNNIKSILIFITKRLRITVRIIIFKPNIHRHRFLTSVRQGIHDCQKLVSAILYRIISFQSLVGKSLHSILINLIAQLLHLIKTIVHILMHLVNGASADGIVRMVLDQIFICQIVVGLSNRLLSCSSRKHSHGTCPFFHNRLTGIICFLQVISGRKCICDQMIVNMFFPGRLV